MDLVELHEDINQFQYSGRKAKIVKSTLVFIGVMLSGFLIGGCDKKDTPTATSGVAAVASTKGGSAKKIQGRCDNETTETPYGSVYFYPENREMFFTLDSMAMRVPVDVTGAANDDGKVSFGFKWRPEKEIVNGSGTVSWVGTSKLNFDFDIIKDSICHPVIDTNFYKNLTEPEFGIKADKYLDAKNHDFMTFQANSQKILNEIKSETIQWFYHIRGKTEAGITIYASSTPPTQDKPVNFAEWNLSTMGDDIIIRYSEKLTRKYSLVK